MNSEMIRISILDDSPMQSEQALVSDDEIFGLGDDFKPNPAKMNPTDWDLAFIETPRINLEHWAKSFEDCFFDQKLSNELKF